MNVIYITVRRGCVSVTVLGSMIFALLTKGKPCVSRTIISWLVLRLMSDLTHGRAEPENISCAQAQAALTSKGEKGVWSLDLGKFRIPLPQRGRACTANGEERTGPGIGEENL